MNINAAFPSKYLKSSDVPEDRDLILTIKEVVMESIGQGDEAEQKPIVYFDEQDKGLVLNKTNAGSIQNLYGPNTDTWTGKRIAIFATEVDFAGKQTLALRVRLKAPANPATGREAPPELLTSAQAIAALEAAGLDKEVLKTYLVGAGYVTPDTGKALYSPARDSAWVLAKVAEQLAAPQEL